MSLLPSSMIYKPSAGGGYNAMGNLVASACCDLDATIAASYGGTGQTWANLETTPADSSSQSANDFHFGDDGTATTDDPTFTGTPGSGSAYFLLDGGDYFTAKNPTTTLVNNIHKTNCSGWWVACTFYLPGAQTGNIALWGSSWNNTDHGVYPWLVGSGGTSKTATLWRSYGTGLDSQTITGASIPEATPSILIVSGDNTTGTNNVRTWLNSATKSQVSKSWSAGTTNLNGGWRIGSTDGAGTNQGIMRNGTRIYALSYGNAFIDDASAAAIIGEYETRHGRDYTP